MSTVGTSPISELTASRPLTLAEPQVTSAAAASGPVSPGPATTPAPVAQLMVSKSLDAGPMPIDSDRVAEIKKAIASNSYLLNPAKIGDAMIAAGMLLGTKA